jgi:hypothetical protein
VRETAEEVVRRIVEFRRRIFSPAGDPSGLCDPADPAGGLEQPAPPEETGDAA